MQLIIGLLTVDLYLPGAGNLKEKRMVVKGIKDRIRNKYNVSISEVDFQDKWQRARLGIVQVGTDYNFIQQNMDRVFSVIEGNHEVQVVDYLFEFI